MTFVGNAVRRSYPSSEERSCGKRWLVRRREYLSKLCRPHYRKRTQYSSLQTIDAAFALPPWQPGSRCRGPDACHMPSGGHGGRRRDAEVLQMRHLRGPGGRRGRATRLRTSGTCFALVLARCGVFAAGGCFFLLSFAGGGGGPPMPRLPGVCRLNLQFPSGFGLVLALRADCFGSGRGTCGVTCYGSQRTGV
jgi:hypothetical protein